MFKVRSEKGFKASDAFDRQFVEQYPSILKALISPHYVIDEADYLRQLIPLATLAPAMASRITQVATELVIAVRSSSDSLQLVDALLLEYGLNTQEGVVLMCLAETLLRIPDEATVDALIRDKLRVSDWESHLRHSDSLLVNASTWGLMLTGKLVSLDTGVTQSPLAVIGRLVSRLGEPVVRQAMQQATRIIARQFVQGRTIDEALVAGKDASAKGYTHSYDMLGEAAITAAQADQYFQDYLAAIEAVGVQYQRTKSKAASQNSVAAADFQKPVQGPSVSIKLSALHPRYESTQHERVKTELLARLLTLVAKARDCDIGITLDAEEADRLELSLDLFEALYTHPVTKGWNLLGLAVQAYSKRALPVLVWLASLARQQGGKIPVRLVKGAYWDSEIKWAQQMGLESYPVFTRKEATDMSYLVCARLLLSDPVHELFYPQFATHNAHTVASIHCLAAAQKDFEFQRLYGMGESLYETVRDQLGGRLRIYAPVGSYQDVLPYLARRLLENGANSSFVHRLVDSRQPIASLIGHPVEVLQSYSSLRNEKIPLPPLLFAGRDETQPDKGRRNSSGCNIHVASQRQSLQESVGQYWHRQWIASAVVNGEDCHNGIAPAAVYCPFNNEQTIGQVFFADQVLVERAIDSAAAAFESWRQIPVTQRAEYLEHAADLLEQHRGELIALCQLEGGRILKDAIDEVREAVDFCRYYALQARRSFGQPVVMPGVTGESNHLSWSGRGIFVCISPWNFPLAIFTGQIMAALVSGNTVIAKPAEQTSLIAHRAVQLFHQAGIPGDVLHLLPGAGNVIGNHLAIDSRIACVAFTGSTETARRINLNLAERPYAAIATLIAETGGQNAMIVDSTALPEQVIRDVVTSAFGSAGQRCSALRVLYLQQEVADKIIQLLAGAMRELQVGDPRELKTDIGPIIDREALESLQQHRDTLYQTAQFIAEAPLHKAETQAGTFLAPIAFAISGMQELHQEHFGPILHIVRYESNRIDQVIEEINQSGYGLTLSIHSRNASFSEHIAANVRVGNIYINRNQIGAVVGSQPFGGQHLSGTGPKTGGPHYLLRFATECTITTNTSAMGCNAELFL